ncbi:MAG: VOC family protein [Acidobacteria bacterium]|nr:VOC family protein [Acidobacteriota bacterium]
MPLDFNHAMIYSRNVSAAVKFYHGLLGLDLLETFEHQGMKVDARLRSPSISLSAARRCRPAACGCTLRRRTSRRSASGW